MFISMLTPRLNIEMNICNMPPKCFLNIRSDQVGDASLSSSFRLRDFSQPFSIAFRCEPLTYSCRPGDALTKYYKSTHYKIHFEFPANGKMANGGGGAEICQLPTLSKIC